MQNLSIKDILDISIFVANLFAIFTVYLKIEIRLTKIEEALKFVKFLEKRQNGNQSSEL